MQMHVITAELGDGCFGPYTDAILLQKTLTIIQKLDPAAEIVDLESDPHNEQILAGLLPYMIHVDIVGGEPQLPAEVSITWPPAEQEGIQEGTPEYTDYFVWAKNEKDALLRLARINKTTSAAPRVEAEA